MSITIAITKKEAIGLIKLIQDMDIEVLGKDMNTILLTIDPLSKFVLRLYSIRTARSKVKISLSCAAALYMIFNKLPIESYNHLLDISQKIQHFISVESYNLNKRFNLIES
jgi:hypothetical protein